jgi:hypothetical protein
MQTHHREASLGPTTAHIEEALVALAVDGRQQQTLNARLGGTLHSLVAILVKLTSVEMRVGIYQIYLHH